MKRAIWLFLAIFACVSLFSFSQKIFASDSDSCADAPQAVQEAIKSNVLIFVFEKIRTKYVFNASATGTVIAPNFIISAAHIMQESDGKRIPAASLKVFARRNLQDNLTWEIKLIDYSDSSDLSLWEVCSLGDNIKIAGLDFNTKDPKLLGTYSKEKSSESIQERTFSLKPISISDSSLNLGEKCWVNGFATSAFLNICFKVSAVSEVKNTMLNWVWGIKKICIFQGHVQPGFSGSAILNEEGKIVGIAAMMESLGAIVYASPLELIREFLDQIKDPDFVKAFK